MNLAVSGQSHVAAAVAAVNNAASTLDTSLLYQQNDHHQQQPISYKIPQVFKWVAQNECKGFKFYPFLVCIITLAFPKITRLQNEIVLGNPSSSMSSARGKRMGQFKMPAAVLWRLLTENNRLGKAHFFARAWMTVKKFQNLCSKHSCHKHCAFLLPWNSVFVVIVCLNVWSGRLCWHISGNVSDLCGILSYFGESINADVWYWFIGSGFHKYTSTFIKCKKCIIWIKLPSSSEWIILTTC